MTRALITLDLDHTLWNPDAALRHAELTSHAWLADAAPAFGIQFPLATFIDWRTQLHQQHPTLKHRVSETRRVAFMTALEHVGLPATQARELADDAFAVFWRLRQQVQMFDDTQAVLHILSSRYTLGALSNGNACLDTIGLARFFAFHFAAEDFPAAKPAPDMFLAALAHAAYLPGNCVHIGDHPMDDIQGAKNVGMKTVWVNLTNQSWPETLSAPDAQVTTLQAIPAALANLLAT